LFEKGRERRPPKWIQETLEPALQRNLLATVAIVASSFVHVWIAVPLVPPEYALVINLIVIPLVLGSLAGYFLVGHLFLKLALLAFIPLVHVLYFGRDEAKPGLGDLVALGELVILWIGCLISHLIVRWKTVRSSQESQPQL
jgi:hypothetical protein